jgi:CheY-like chemotaxis protein
VVPEKSMILYIEDDLDDQIIFRECVNHVRPDIICKFATSALEALEKLSDPAFKPACIFIDVNMPVMNGNEFLRAIKAIPALTHIPCFMLSTSKSRKDVDLAMADGAVKYLVKPAVYIDFENLLQETLQNVSH